MTCLTSLGERFHLSWSGAKSQVSRRCVTPYDPACQPSLRTARLWIEWPPRGVVGERTEGQTLLLAYEHHRPTTCMPGTGLSGFVGWGSLSSHAAGALGGLQMSSSTSREERKDDLGVLRKSLAVVC